MPEPVSRRQPQFEFDIPPDVEGAQAGRRLPRATMEDPLEELARILGETTGYPARPEPAETGRRGDAIARPGPQQLSALEAELFDELRASVTPETRVRGDFEREITPPIPQHPVDDRDIASLRIGTGRVDPEPPRSAEGAAAQWSDFYAYDDGVAAGSYDPAFGHDPRLSGPGTPVDVTTAEALHMARAARGEPAYPHATFDEFGREEIAEAARESAPLVAAEPRIMPHSREEERAAARLPHEGGGNGMKIAIAAVALVLVGGGALAAWKFTGGTGGGEPVLVRADGKPLKTLPDPKAATADPSPSLGPDDPKAPPRIVSKQEDPVDQVSARTPEGKEVRLVNPGAQRPSGDVPHTVKTVVVRPDGSIVSDGVAVRAARPEAPPPAPEAPPAPPSAASAQPVLSTVTTSPVPKVSPLPAPAPALNSASLPKAPPPPAAPAPSMQATAPAPATPPVEIRPPAPKPSTAAAPPPPAPTVAAPKVKTVAVTSSTAAKPADGAPMSLGPVGPRLAAPPPAQQAAPPPPPAAPKPVASAPVTLAPPPAATGSGDFMVQISASGSEGEARNSFAAAQRKYSALAGRSVDVQRADLGSKGVFYRARVPAGSREQAAALCSQLQSQGAQCMVVKR